MKRLHDSRKNGSGSRSGSGSGSSANSRADSPRSSFSSSASSSASSRSSSSASSSCSSAKPILDEKMHAKILKHMAKAYPPMLGTYSRDSKSGNVVNRKGMLEVAFGLGAPDLDKYVRYVINSSVVISLFVM